MAPPMADYGTYRVPDRDNYDSDYAHAFPSKFVEPEADGRHNRYSMPDQHYVTSESKSTPSSKRTRTTSSARRSRKSSTAARDLVRALLLEKIDADDATQSQLQRAYDILRNESKRAADAERLALETAQRLKGVSSARAQALQEAAKAQAELRAYKLQFENAQQQLRTANELMAQTDAERDHAIQSVARMKKAVAKYREGELRRRAIEQGRLEGREEALRDMGARYSRMRDRGTFVEDDDVLRTPTDVTMLPMPPPERVPIVVRRRAESLSRVQTPRTTTPVQSRQIRHSQVEQPNIVRRNTSTPVQDRSQTPWRSIPSPATAAVRQPSNAGTPPAYAHRDEEIENTQYDRAHRMNDIPDHIIIRSPVPTRPVETQTPLQAQFQRVPPRPPSSQASRPTNVSYPPSQRQGNGHAHVPPHILAAQRAAESAGRIYSQVSSSSSETFDPVVPPEAPEVVDYDYTATHEQPFMNPVPPANYFDSTDPPRPVPPPTSDLRRYESVSSSSTGTPRTETTSVKPSRVVKQFRNFFRRGGSQGHSRPQSSSSSSTVPNIQIEPPSRPESAETMAATTMAQQFSSLPSVSAPASGGWGIDPVQRGQHSGTPMGRPPSRTGFMYGPSQHQQVPQSQGFAGGSSSFIPPMQPTPGPALGRGPVGMSFGDPPAVNPAGLPQSGSAADYFFSEHHAPVPSQPKGRRHRRAPSDGTITDPNAYYDPETDPEYEDDTDDGFGRPTTPRASERGVYGYAGSAGGSPADPYANQRSPSRSASRSGRAVGGGYEYDIPPSAAAMDASRRGAEASVAGSRGSRARKVSVVGRERDRDVNRHSAMRSSTSTSRTPHGNTPFVRPGGLDDDD